MTTRHFLTLALLLAGQALTAQLKQSPWKPLGPFSIHKTTGETGAPGLGVMRSIDVHPSQPNRLIMGGMSSGIWLSKDKGKSWRNTSLDLPVENVKKIQIAASNPAIVYAATTVGIIKSTDGGEHWAFTQLNLLHKLPCADREKWNDDRTLLSVAPANPQQVVATAGDTLYQTLDGGTAWTAVLPGWQAQFIEFHPTNNRIVYTGGAYKKDPKTFVILRSEDGGKTYSPSTTGLPDPSRLTRLHDITAAVSKASPDKLYLLIFGDAQVKTSVKQEEKKQMVGAFLVSEDAGKSFKTIQQEKNYRYIDAHYSLFHMYSADEDKERYDFNYTDNSFWQASFQQVGWATAFGLSDRDPQTMVMAASGAVFSKDAGKTWTFLRKQGQYGIHGDIQTAKVIGNDVWLANDGGLNHVDLQTRQQTRMEGFSGQDLWGFSTSFKTDVMAVGVDHSGTMIYDQKLYGKDWYHYGGGDAMTASVNPFDDRYVYATPYDHYIVKRPTHLRDEASSVKSPIKFGYIPNRNVEFHPNDVYTLYAIDEDKPHWRYDTCRVVMSRDNARTVDTLLTFPTKAYGKRVRISVSYPNVLYAIGQKPSQVYLSEDGGKNWTERTPKDSIAVKYPFNDIAIDDRDPQHAWLVIGGYQNKRKVMETRDGGQSWQDYHSAELPVNELLTAAFQRGTEGGIYLGADPGVFYRSARTGKWVKVGTGLPYTPVNFISLNYDKAKIRIGTYRGIWETDLVEDFQPRALIALNKRSLPSGESDERKVFFYDHSAIRREGAKWYWEFPGSIQGSSTEENPIIDYETAKPGKYDVRLTITDSKGRKDTYEMKGAIEVKYNYPWNLREKKLEMEAEQEERERREMEN
ncbi:hypothetical protein KJS94_12570 [Flavihumibacter rivuli]|uniref:hypothetical protein n=1 Tax=Flavihumibacter rivuli TaxID=2838156 RepID=UPI001BDF6110|nr:hypothetical protein [Flavihumibacter rivuli]ULQ55477.1 hypothetical protein KJS94_12570 [Flavihumibacter rivuli]